MTALAEFKPARRITAAVLALAMAFAAGGAYAQTGSRVGSGAFATSSYGDGEEPGELARIRRYLKQNRVDRAIATARDFVRLTENSPLRSQYATTEVYRYQALNALCVALTAGGQTVEAISSCEKAIALFPSRWQALNSLANAHFSAADYDRAIAAYKKALKVAPEYGRARALVEHNLELAEKKN